MTKLRLYGKVSAGSLHTTVSEPQLKEIFGLSIESWTDRNAGNRIFADAHHFRIRNKRLLKPAFKILIRDIELNDDPKRDLYDEDPEYSPE